MDEWLIFPSEQDDDHPKFAYTAAPQKWVGPHFVYRRGWVSVSAENLTESEKDQWWNVFPVAGIQVYTMLQTAISKARQRGMIVNLEKYLGVREVPDWSAFINSQDGYTMQEMVQALQENKDEVASFETPTRPENDWGSLAYLYFVRYCHFIIGNVLGAETDIPSIDKLIANFRRLGPKYELNTAQWITLEDISAALTTLHQEEFAHVPRRTRFSTFIQEFCNEYLEMFSVPGMTPEETRRYLTEQVFLPPGHFKGGVPAKLVYRGVVFSESGPISVVEILDNQIRVGDSIQLDDGNVVSHRLYPELGTTIVEAVDGRISYLSNGQEIDIELLKREEADVPATDTVFPELEQKEIPALYTRLVNSQDGTTSKLYAIEYDQGSLLYCVLHEEKLTWIHSAFYSEVVPEPIQVVLDGGQPAPKAPIPTSGIAIGVLGLLAVAMFLEN